jgi:hypothetical protein
MSAAIRPNRLRAGIFLAPFHPVDEDPTLAIRRDIDLIEHLDRIGFDEAWIAATSSVRRWSWRMRSAAGRLRQA